jgi:hypothetical protein
MLALVGGPDKVDSFLERAAHAITGMSSLAVDGTMRGAELYADFASTMKTADNVALYGILPLGLVLAVLHEQGRSALESSPFRVGSLLIKCGIVLGCYLGFEHVCSLIFSVAGAGKGWMTGDQLGKILDIKSPMNSSHADIGFTDPSSWGNLLIRIILWCLVLLSALFAYLASLLLSLIQHCYLVILLTLGKAAILTSLIPRAGLGGAWARSLAQTAAWSIVAAAITGIMVGYASGNSMIVISGSISECAKASAHLVIYGLCMLSVPMFTSKVFGGGAAAAAGVIGAGALAYKGMKMGASLAGGSVLGAAAGAARAGARGEAMVAGAGAGDAWAAGGGGGHRAGKVGFVQKAANALAGGVLSPAVMAMGAVGRKLEQKGKPAGGADAAAAVGAEKAAPKPAGKGDEAKRLDAAQEDSPPTNNERLARIREQEPGLSPPETYAKADGEWARDQMAAASTPEQLQVASKAANEQCWTRGRELGKDQGAYLEKVTPQLKAAYDAGVARVGGGGSPAAPGVALGGEARAARAAAGPGPAAPAAPAGSASVAGAEAATAPRAKADAGAGRAAAAPSDPAGSHPGRPAPAHAARPAEAVTPVALRSSAASGSPPPAHVRLVPRAARATVASEPSIDRRPEAADKSDSPASEGKEL